MKQIKPGSWGSGNEIHPSVKQRRRFKIGTFEAWKNPRGSRPVWMKLQGKVTPKNVRL